MEEEIDGSLLEGGGQVLRNCIAYAAILRKPITISNIRGGRDKPGLKRQHLTGLQLAADLTSAQTTGLEQESQRITFAPGPISGGRFVGNIGSAGACTLLAQITIPIALFAPDATTLLLRGGTNVPFSPPAEYLTSVLLPTLRKFHIRGLEIDILKPGFMPAGGGEIRVTVQPNPVLQPVALVNRGAVRGCTVYVTGICTEGFEREMVEAIRAVERGRVGGPVTSVLSVQRCKKDKGQVQVLFVAATEGEHCIGGSAIGGGKSTGKKVVESAFKSLLKQLDKGICVDEHLQDQVIIFMALAQGSSSMRCGELTLHTKTAMHFATVLTAAVFEVDEVEPGVNLVRCIPSSTSNTAA